MAHIPKPYELLEVRPDGTEVRLYEDGTKRNQRGQALTLPKVIQDQQITSETAYIRHKQRKDKILRAIEQKVQDVTKTNAPAEAIAYIVGKRAKVAISDESKVGNDAAKIVLAALDAYQDKRPQEQTSTIRNEYIMDDETRALLHAMIQERRDTGTDTTDADVIEYNDE